MKLVAELRSYYIVGSEEQTYYSLLFGPIDGSTLNWMEDVVDTSTLGTMSCREV
jgi:hypothetical protein